MNEEKEIQDLENEFSAFDGKQSFKLPDDYMNQLKSQVKQEVKKEKSISIKRFLWPAVAAACIIGILFNLDLSPKQIEVETYAFEEVSLDDFSTDDFSEEELAYFLEEESGGLENEETELIEDYLMDEIEDISIIEDELLKCIKC